MKPPKKSKVTRGTLTRYAYGCRCDSCKQARLDYEREKTAKQREAAARAQESMLPDLLRTKTCAKCGETKPVEEFRRDGRRMDGRQQWCKVCKSAYQRSRYTTEKGRELWLKRKFGMTPADLEALFGEQGGKCAICGRSDSKSKLAQDNAAKHGSIHTLHLDHDHETGQRRSLLCGTCNRGIGMFFDDPELMLAAVAYLRGWQAKRIMEAS